MVLYTENFDIYKVGLSSVTALFDFCRMRFLAIRPQALGRHILDR